MNLVVHKLAVKQGMAPSALPIMVLALYRVRSDLCGLCRALQVLHLQCGMSMSRSDTMAGHQLLHCLRNSALLRVLSLTRCIRVRKYPVGP